MTSLRLNRQQYLEVEKLAFGAFAPLTGFMNEDAFASVASEMRLPDGTVFPLPVVLDVALHEARTLREGHIVDLLFQDRRVGSMRIDSLYRVEREPAAARIFGTADPAHPGVAHFLRMGECFAGGPVTLDTRVSFEFSAYDLAPAETRAIFRERGWKTVVGFQTRNIPHRAHEYLQRLALEQADGLFIQPLVGYKKRGDFNPMAILTAYRTLVDRFLPSERVLVGVLTTAMRYAGPREALFHAIIRRNYGCTHFVVGRDHAGVGNYYGRYEAHELTRRFERELGIAVLRFSGPFYCARCEGIVTERTCGHAVTAPDAVQEISGSRLRAHLTNGGGAPSFLIRPEVVASVSALPLFIDEDEA